MSATAEQPLLRQSHGDVVILSLNRPRQRNSLVWETWSAFEAALGDMPRRLMSQQSSSRVQVGSSVRVVT